jgi:hypothetical protein
VTSDLEIRAAGRQGWSVIAPDHTSEAVDTFRTKVRAVEHATGILKGRPGGGTLRIYLADGRLGQSRNIGGAALTPPKADALSPSVREMSDVFRQIQKEGKKVDKAMSSGLKLAIWAAPLTSSGLSAFVSTEVQEAMGKGWWAVFLATLTWSLGCLGATVLLIRKTLAGWPLAGAIAAMFSVALLVATALGRGVLELDSADSASNPLELIGMFVQAAFTTYGPLGAIAGAGVGGWLGSRLAPLVR